MTGQRTQHVHFLGIGGSGLSPLAQIHLAGGGTVSGSDSEDSPRVATLRARGVPIRVGPAPDAAALNAELAGVDVVVASSALPDDHPEILAARALGLPVRRRAQWLPELTADYRLVAVAGSHGKSTTAAMLTLVLRAARLDPTAVIGAEVSQLGGNALAGSGDIFVLESDEYGGAFAGLDPSIAVITNVEWEHPDLFPDEAAVRAAFAAFARRVRPGGRLVVCGDHPGVVAVLAELERTDRERGEREPGAPPRDVTVIDYGFEPDRRWRAVDVIASPGDDTTRATVLCDGTAVGTLNLAVPGRHTVLNALAVLATAAELGVSPDQSLATLATFTGAARRFEFVGFWTAAAPVPPAIPAPATELLRPSAGPAITTGGGAGAGRAGADAGAASTTGAGLEIIDDYAHHPTEIQVTLGAARSRARGREVWAVLQPHTFSRLAALLDGFAAAFPDADRLYVTDIYAARETDDLGLRPQDLVSRVTRPAAAHYVPWAELVDRLATDVAAALDHGGTAAAPGAPAGPPEQAGPAEQTRTADHVGTAEWAGTAGHPSPAGAEYASGPWPGARTPAPTLDPALDPALDQVLDAFGQPAGGPAGAPAGGGRPAASASTGILLLTLGAGTITTVGPRLLDSLAARPGR